MEFNHDKIKNLYKIIKSTGYISSKESSYNHIINYMFKIQSENMEDYYEIDNLIKKQFGLTDDFKDVKIHFFDGYFSDFGNLKVLYNGYQFSQNDIMKKFGLQIGED